MRTDYLFPIVLVAFAAVLAFGRRDSKRFLVYGICAIAGVVLIVILTTVLT